MSFMIKYHGVSLHIVHCDIVGLIYIELKLSKEMVTQKDHLASCTY